MQTALDLEAAAHVAFGCVDAEAMLSAATPAPSATAQEALSARRAAGRTKLIDATAIHCNPSSALNLAKANPRLRPLHLVVRETEFCGLRLAGYFRRRTRENSRNSVRRPRCASLTRRNYAGFCLPGNRPGLSGLHGGGCRDRTDGHRSLASLQNEAARRGFSARNDLSQRMSKWEAARTRNTAAGSHRASVENEVQRLLPQGRASAEPVAKALALSARTLSRRLSEEGTTFTQVVDQLRRSLALQYLKDPGFASADVAWLLGYEGQTSFNHAFRRWTGHSPSAARKAEKLSEPM